MLAQRGRWCGKNLEYAEGIHVSKRATAIPYHIRPLSIAGIELGSQQEYVREVFSESTMQKRMNGCLARILHNKAHRQIGNTYTCRCKIGMNDDVDMKDTTTVHLRTSPERSSYWKTDFNEIQILYMKLAAISFGQFLFIHMSIISKLSEGGNNQTGFTLKGSILRRQGQPVQMID
nr:uncharacterized protein LOC105342357 isoform X2 [Crassostrea gigas]